MSDIIRRGLLFFTVFAQDEDDVLVVGATELPAIAGGRGPAVEHRYARVRGVVRIFRVGEIERELGADLDDGLFGGWEGEPVVIAREVDYPVARPEPAGASPDAVLVSVEEVAENPEAFVGRQVILSGIIVEALGARSFVLHE